MKNLEKLQGFLVGSLAVLIGIADLLLRPFYGGLLLRDLLSRDISIIAMLILLAIVFWAHKKKQTIVLYLALTIFWSILLSL